MGRLHDRDLLHRTDFLCLAAIITGAPTRDFFSSVTGRRMGHRRLIPSSVTENGDATRCETCLQPKVITERHARSDIELFGLSFSA